MLRTLSRRELLRGASLALPAWALGAARGGTANSPLPFKLGIITDEITQDLAKAVEFLKSYSLEYCELRELWDKNLMNASQEELTRARRILRKHGMRVSNLASPLFKYDLPEMPGPESQRDIFRAQFTDQDTDRLLEKASELAHFFDTRLIRIFSYWRVEDPEKAYPYVRDRLARAAKVAEKNRVILCLENEPACNVGSGRELGRLLKDVHSPHLRGVWDPGNAVTLGEAPYPEGYNAVRGLFAHLHVKDLKKDEQTGKWIWVPVGQGVADFRGLFKVLRQEEYTGTVSLETHYRRADGNALESTRESLEGLLKVLREI
jgi:sugar phosphate isomerase/epimerase